MNNWDCLVIGGGASGFFCAINILQSKPSAKVLILEKTNKTLSKVRISGGGRCNVTHDISDPKKMSTHYPRGAQLMKKQLKQFGVIETIDWFNNAGITLVAEEDGRMFPMSNKSETIAAFFEEEYRKLGGVLHLKAEVINITPNDEGYSISCQNSSYLSKSVVFAVGGIAKKRIEPLLPHSIDIKETLPSLFSMKINDIELTSLSGISIPNSRVKVAGREWYAGPLLITHWGLSGPSILKMSAFDAEYLHQLQYQSEILVDWTGGLNEGKYLSIFSDYAESSMKSIQNERLFNIPQRLWEYILMKSEIDFKLKFRDLSKLKRNKLMESLMRMPFTTNGKTTFKEEFVTCGGVSVNELKANYELKHLKNTYAIGEVINVDGVTGGFNFQNAWTSAYVAGQSIAQKIS